MSGKVKLRKKINEDITALLEAACITSIHTKLIIGNLHDLIKREDCSFTQINLKDYLVNILALRRNLAYMHFLTTVQLPIDNAEAKELYNTALAKYRAAETREEEFKKKYNAIDALELTIEEFLKYLKD